MEEVFCNDELRESALSISSITAKYKLFFTTSELHTDPDGGFEITRDYHRVSLYEKVGAANWCLTNETPIQDFLAEDEFFLLESAKKCCPCYALLVTIARLNNPDDPPDGIRVYTDDSGSITYEYRANIFPISITSSACTPEKNGVLKFEADPPEEERVYSTVSVTSEVYGRVPTSGVTGLNAEQIISADDAPGIYQGVKNCTWQPPGFGPSIEFTVTFAESGVSTSFPGGDNAQVTVYPYGVRIGFINEWGLQPVDEIVIVDGDVLKKTIKPAEGSITQYGEILYKVSGTDAYAYLGGGGTFDGYDHVLSVTAAEACAGLFTGQKVAVRSDYRLRMKWEFA